DIGYRGRAVQYVAGRLGQEKRLIGQGVLERSAAHGFAVDIAWTEDRRIYGPRWDRFIGSCKTMLGTESGASIVDWDGSLERRVDAYLADVPSASFEEVHRNALAADEGNLELNVVSPRVFEAIAHRTALVQFPGEYSGVIQADEHYIPLA